LSQGSDGLRSAADIFWRVMKLLEVIKSLWLSSQGFDLLLIAIKKEF